MDLLSITQIIVSILLIAAVLLQQKGALLGSGFGGSDTGASFQHVRRGSEKKLYYTTIVLAIIFLALSILHLII